MSNGKLLNIKNLLKICVIYTNLLFSHIEYAVNCEKFN